MSAPLKWNKLPLDISELKLSTVLRCGQTFRWKQNGDVWSIGYKSRVILLRQDDLYLHYFTIPAKNGPKLEESDHDVIFDYFNLDTNLQGLYRYWSDKDARFHKMLSQGDLDLGGIRILRQNPWENLCSFICSTNNNIKRISSMVENLCTHFGKFIASYDGVDYYDFPTPEDLAHASIEARLRALGFGYRAKYLNKTAQAVVADPLGESRLSNLRLVPYEEAHEALMEYTGVGPKVADCVCLMSLDKHDCVPVDTHVWQIAQRDYKYGRNFKTLNKVNYTLVGDYFRKLWGPYAGWAQSVAFTADLKDLNNGVKVKEEEQDPVVRLVSTKNKNKRPAADLLEETVPLVKKIAT